MTMSPEWRKCTKCNKKYSFNPSLGRIVCPYCGSPMSVPASAPTALERLIKKLSK